MKTMLTTRDIKVALAAAVITLTGAGMMRAQTAVMGSRIFEWDALKVEKTKVGARRDVVRLPTATLDELEMHITTLDAGQASHAPHQHPAEELIIIKEGTLESFVNGEYQQGRPRLDRLPGVQSAARDQERRHHAGDLSRSAVAIAGHAQEIARGFAVRGFAVRYVAGCRVDVEVSSVRRGGSRYEARRGNRDRGRGDRRHVVG